MAELNASFSLFPVREKKSEKSPDVTGSIEISVDQLNDLISHLGTEPEQNYKGEAVVKLRIAGWNATSKAGVQYINGKVSKPMQQQQQSTADVSDLF